MRAGSTSCCRSAAGKATAEPPITRARRSRRSPGPPGLLAQTERITVFGTVHAPLFPPIIAAKQIVTADHVGEGRFGLNIVCGWNEGEFEMFGVQPGDHERRYAQGQEWIDALRRIWTEDDFDFDGDIINLHGVRVKPKPWRRTRPMIMNAGRRRRACAFALRNCDALFTTVRRASNVVAPLEEAARRGRRGAKPQARAYGHEIGVFSVGVITVRPTQREADDYARYVDENTDWNAVDAIMEMKGLNDRPPDVRERIRAGYARGHGRLADRRFARCGRREPRQIAAAGFNGIAISFVNYIDELPYFRDEVLPRLERLGLRTPAASAPRRSAAYRARSAAWPCSASAPAPWRGRGQATRTYGIPNDDRADRTPSCERRPCAIWRWGLRAVGRARGRPPRDEGGPAGLHPRTARRSSCSPTGTAGLVPPLVIHGAGVVGVLADLGHRSRLERD